MLRRDKAVDWPAFTLWLSALLRAHGSRIVRVKGLLRTTASAAPLVIHGVQHVVHPPRHLRPEDDDGQLGYLVFITSGIGRQEIEKSLERFLRRMRRVAPSTIRDELEAANAP